MQISKRLFFCHLMLALFVWFCFCDRTLLDKRGWTLVGTGFNFPEGPAWDMKETLYISNCYGNWISKVYKEQIDTLIAVSDTAFVKTNGLVVGKDGNIIACDFGRGAILHITPPGKLRVLVSGYYGEAFHRPNDVVMDQQGNIYFTDPKSYGVEKIDGRLFYYNIHAGDLKLVADSLAFPNGLNISPIDGKLYVCESAKNQIIRFERMKEGMLKSKELFILLPGGDPDGIDFDVKGNLYVAHFGNRSIYVISPEGNILEQINTPGRKPTNLEFGGSDLRTLYLTEAETNSVYKIKTKNPGYKPF